MAGAATALSARAQALETEYDLALLSARQSGARVPLPTLYPQQQRIVNEAGRFNVVNVGRRAGKTYLGVYLALAAVLDGKPVGWFAPNYKYLLEAWAEIARRLRPVAARINATERRIELSNGGVFECWTLDNTDDPGRGRKYALAIIDEAAIAPRLKGAWEEAIRPTLTDLRGSAWFLSTPKGLNAFYALYQQGLDRLAHSDWRCWQLPSSINPFLPSDEIEAARGDLPDLVFRQEYLAEFLTAEGAVFRRVDECLTAPLTSPAAHRGHLLVAGVDWARLHDFTACSIVCCHCRAEVALDRFNKIGWDFQRQRLLALLTTWGVRYCVVESNSIGSPNLEAISQAAPEGLSFSGFETTAKSKPKLIQSLALAFEKHSLAWLPDQVGRFELISYEATVTETGYIRYSAPEGGFDDTVIARALAWHKARPKIPVPLTFEQQVEAELPPHFRRDYVAVQPFDPLLALARQDAMARAEREVEERERMDGGACTSWANCL